MAVFERTYRRWQGQPTARAGRFLVLFRYSIGEVFRSKWLTAYFALCFVYPLGSLLLIYLRRNAPFLTVFPGFEQAIAVDPGFFGVFVTVQQVFGFLLAVTVGPGLISRDLVNNGLPLYLSRPFTRGEYLLGKFSVLALLLSAVTWVPGLLLMLVHSSLVGWSWLGENASLVAGLFVGSWFWIVGISLMAMAVSAWVRWRFLAGFGMIFFALAGGLFHAMVSGITQSTWGYVFDLPGLLHVVWLRLLGDTVATGLPTVAALIALAGFFAFFFGLLHLKLRAYEVIR
ncbi:MAG: hypothetical protein AAGC60_12510 [Acidobacteriota bacterium]